MTDSDWVSSLDDRLRAALLVAEHDLESAEVPIQDDDRNAYTLRARPLEDAGEHGRVIHLEESAGAGLGGWHPIAHYDRESIDNLAADARAQIQKLQFRQRTQGHRTVRQTRADQKVRHRTEIQQRFRDARLDSWNRGESGSNGVELFAANLEIVHCGGCQRHSLLTDAKAIATTDRTGIDDPHCPRCGTLVANERTSVLEYSPGIVSDGVKERSGVDGEMEGLEHV